MDVRLSARAGAAVAGIAAAAFGLGSAAIVGHAGEQNIPGINSCPNGNVYVAEYEGGNPQLIGNSSTPNIINKAAGDADGNPGGSNAGDTVIVCSGTYTGTAVSVQKTGGDDTAPDTSKDNVTIRSFSGPNNTVLVTNGTGTPAFTVDANGVTIGGPALGFTIENPAVGTPSSPLIEVGTPGAQSTANEDEACTEANNMVAVSSGCDANAPAYVAENDRVVDNIFTRLVPNAGFSGTINGIELDNTINNTLESNLFTNEVQDHTAAGTLNGIVVGTSAAASSSCTNCTTGYSTNINTALFQNAFRQLLNGGNSTCTSATAISLDGWVLDSQVYNNLVQQLINNSSKCAVTGIESNAFGQLENEQTGTLVPTNGNIDDNTIGQLGNQPNTGTGILLDPQPEQVENDPPVNGFCDTPSGPVPSAGTCPGQAAPPSSYTVQNNQIQQVKTGVDVEDLLGTNSYVHDTNFQNVLVGVNAAASATPTVGGSTPEPTYVDATNNFWGCDDGPSPTPADADDNNCAKTTGQVAFNPWLNSPVEQAGDEAGDNAGQS